MSLGKRSRLRGWRPPQEEVVSKTLTLINNVGTVVIPGSDQDRACRRCSGSAIRTGTR